MSGNVGSIRRLWWKWKMLRLPWRKQFLIGFDLSGNTFWEFQDQLNVGRIRRIIKYSTDVHYADVKISPSWIQWLRHTRADPPTINEQQLDEIRQSQMKQLAAAADARWASKPSVLDAPSKAQAQTGAKLRDPGGYIGQTEPMDKEGVRDVAGSTEEISSAQTGRPIITKSRFAKEPKKNPWNEADSKSNQQEPAKWTPGATRSR